MHAHNDAYERANHWCSVAYWAAQENHLDIVQWIYENRPDDFVEVLEGAIEGGHLTVAKYAKARMNYISRNLFLTSMELPMLHCILFNVAWARETAYHRFIRSAMVIAANDGCFPMLEQLNEYRTTEPISLDVMHAAASKGHRELIIWLSTKRVVVDADSKIGAAENGFLKLLQRIYKKLWPERSQELALCSQGRPI